MIQNNSACSLLFSYFLFPLSLSPSPLSFQKDRKEGRVTLADKISSADWRCQLSACNGSKLLSFAYFSKNFLRTLISFQFSTCYVSKIEYNNKKGKKRENKKQKVEEEEEEREEGNIHTLKSGGIER